MSYKISTFFVTIILCVPALAQKKSAPAATKPATKSSAPKAGSSYEHKGYPIVELSTSGSERYDAEDILKFTGLRQSKTVETSLDDVKAAAEKLVGTGAFLEVNYKHTASAGGMKVEFIVSDKDDDQFVKCDFANIVWLPEKDLLIDLHDRVPLFNGTVPRDGTLADDVAKALQALLNERSVAATVSNEHQDASNGDPATELVTYRVADIDIKIAKVELAGASPEMQAEADKASKQINGLIYNRVTVQRFLEHNLRNVYLRHGYLRASFGEPEIKVADSSGTQTKIELKIPVTEGAIYKAGTLRWTGNKAMLAESLTPYLHLTPGTVVDGALLARDVDRLRLHYATLGYLHMRLTPKPAFDEAANVVNYEMPIREGDLFSMGKFDVEGLAQASALKVRDAWQLREGEPFDPLYLRDFFKKFRMPSETEYIVDEVEGERPRSVDVTVIFCKPGDPCKPKNENRLYTPPASDDDKDK